MKAAKFKQSRGKRPKDQKEAKEVLTSALAYAKLGWPVIPIYGLKTSPDGQFICTCSKGADCESPGKHPITSNGLKAASSDPDIVHSWFDWRPTANLAIATGGASGLVVLDVDPRHGGDKSLEELQHRHGRLPDTITAKTGGGGWHFFFQHPEGLVRNSTGRLGPGLDVKGDGGYVVAPPSQHASGGRYDWAEGDEPNTQVLVPPPTWLLELLVAKPPPTGGTVSPDEKIVQGERNDTLFSMACGMRRRKMSQSAIDAALLEENRTRCEPPLEENEVKRIAASAVRYSPIAHLGGKFVVKPDGIYVWAGKGEHSATQWICSPLEIVAETRNHASESWGRILKFPNRDGKLQSYLLSMKLLAGDSAAWCGELLDLGLRINPTPFARQALAQYISAANPKKFVRSVHRVGWHGQAFILPDETFGGTDSEEVALHINGAGSNHAFHKSGTLEDWQREVGAHCVGNSRLIFSASAAFAALLIHPLSAESGGFHLKGASSIGKTTGLLVAGSVWGGGGLKGYIRQWRTTANGLEGIAAAHCDTLLCLDEISQVGAKEAGEIAYMLANGAGKSRARRDGSTRPPVEWRTLFISSGELSLADKVAEDGRRRATAGQRVRVVDVPADAGAGLGLFENLHDAPNGHAFAGLLQKACESYYGLAAGAFLKKLTENVEAARETATRHSRSFVQRCVPAGVDGQIKRVAERFALVAAAGEMAIEFGVVPWSPGEAEAGVVRCFLAWLNERGGTGPAELLEGVAQVRRFIESHGESRFSEWKSVREPEYIDDRIPTRDRAGYRRKLEDGRTEYYIFPETWKTEVCKGFDPGAVAAELVRLGCIIPDKSGKPASPQRPPGYQSALRLYRLSSAILESDGMTEPDDHREKSKKALATKRTREKTARAASQKF